MKAHLMSDTYVDEIAEDVVDQGSAGWIYRRFGKRVLDVVAVILILPVVLPVIVSAWGIMFVGGGSGFYSQARVGRDGRVFRCWKIRTMAPDADRKLATFIKSDPQIALEWQKTQKLENDPRITAIGNFFRRSSIDELPQLWNVLTGEMSLIGPRPFTPNQKALYDAGRFGLAYYRLRPGISGLWQTQSRNLGAFQDRVSYDESYAETMSLLTDMRIALRTVVVILRATGK